MDESLIDILIRGIAAGLLLATGTSIARADAPPAQRISGAFFTLSAIAYVLQHDAVLQWLGDGAWLVRITAVLGTGALWLFMLTLFADPPRFRRWHAAPFPLLLAFAFTGWFGPAEARTGAWLGHNVMEGALILHGMATILRGWRDDLVEARRRLRLAFLVMVALLAFSISAVEGFALYLGLPPQAERLGAIAVALAALAGAIVLLQTRAFLFAPPEPLAETVAGPPRSETPLADRMELARILDLVDRDQIWRREGLTIGALAEAAGLPEHRARRLINAGLGHRNFTDFINARRIEAAKAALRDPARARATVAEIAFDLGFGSLGPFNRAFKDATGQTPTAWRREAQGEAGRNQKSLADSENAKDS